MSFRSLVEPYINWFRLFLASWHSASASIVGPCLAILMGLITGRGLGAAALGDFGAIAAFFGWFYFVMGYPIYAKLPVLLAEHRQHPARMGKIAGTVLALWTLLSLAGIVPAIIWLPLRLHGLQLDALYGAGVLYAASLLVVQYKVILDVYMTYAGWMRRWSLSAIAGSLIHPLILGGWLLARGPFTIAQYVACGIIGNIAMLAVATAIFFYGSDPRRALRPDLRLAWPLLAGGFGPWLGMIGTFFFSYGIPTMIADHLPSRELGYYNVALTLYTYIILIGMSISAPATAEWSRLVAARRFDALRRDLRQRQLATGVVLATAALLCGIFAKPLLLGLYGREYLAAVPVFRLSLPIFLTAGFGNWYPTALYAMGHTRRIGLPNVAFAIPTAAAAWAILNWTHFGILGVQAATTLGNIAWALLFAHAFHRALRQEIARDAAPAALPAVGNG